jgi:hypothetical protein
MNTDREKLINWIRNTYVSNPPYTYKATVDDTADAVIADYLIANGVVVREKGEWRLETDEEELHPMFKLVVCRVCNQKSSEMGSFCPNCGADMRGNKNV